MTRTEQRNLIRVLENGGVAIFPCDTIYGIVGRVPDTEERIRSIKGREETKPFLRLVARKNQIVDSCSRTLPEEILSAIPAPLTLIIPTRDGGTLGIRVPEDKRLRELIETVGPLYSTSVNRSGAAALFREDAIREEFGTEVDMILGGGDLKDRAPSTILDLTGDSPRILREGAFAVPRGWLEIQL